MWTDKSRKPNKRFSYLLLEDGDHYIQDWMASCRPGLVGPGGQKPSQQRKLKGRLRLCSRAIYFEPDSIKAPILMFPFAKVKKIEQLAESPPTTTLGNNKWRNLQEGFVLDTSMTVKMKEEGIDAPYVFEKKDSIWWFSLEFAPVQQFLRQAQSLLSINSLPFAERDMILQNAAAQREAKAQFDTSRLVDLSEQVLLDYPAAQVTPLVREPGRLVLTQARLYFQVKSSPLLQPLHWQPLQNLNNDSPVRSHPYSEVLAVARRRHALRPMGIEIFFKEDPVSRVVPGGGVSEGASAFFTFQTLEQRDKVVSTLLEQLGGQTGAAAAAGSLLEADSAWLNRVTAAWQARLVSNYDYLMYLNLAAGRSFCDLTQWPIMPWVLCDYKSSMLDLADPKVFCDLSKPIGALNPSRLAVFLERFNQMPQGENSHPPFLYGTHYSTPGYVLYWLVRAAPAHMLRLQNGRFDAPDRLFASVADSWESVLSNPADLKELIPEFYAPPSDFLVKREGLNLGVCQSGEAVGDVKLPPWAKDPDDFISKHRQALESQHVSMRLHVWIDLIFGYKQRGEAAVASDNLFHHLTYEGAVDLETIDDPVERAGLEAQINEFGQAPRQLFTTTHPPRLLRRKTAVIDSATLSDYSTSSEGFRGLSMEFVSRIMALASTPTDNSTLKSPIITPTLYSANAPLQSSTVKFLLEKPSVEKPLEHRAKYQPATPLPPPSMRSATSDEDNSSCATTPGEEDGESYRKGHMTVSDMYSGSEASPSGSGLQNARDPFDVVRCVEVLLPSTLRKSALVNNTGKNVVTETVDKEESNAARFDFQTIVTSGKETKGGEELAWHWMFRQRLSEPQCLKLHRGPVNALVLSEENASGSVTMYSVDKDGFIKVYSISEGFQVRATKLGTLPLSCVTLARSTDAYPTVLAGSYDDFVYAYSVDYGRALGKMRVHDETVSCVRMTGSGSQRMLTASWDSTVKLWGIAEGRGGWAATNTAQAIPEVEFLEHEAAVWCLDVQPSGGLVVSGGEDGTVITWDLRNPTSSIWQSSTGSSTRGLRLSSDANQVVVASTDGALRVLEMRQGGAELAIKQCGSSLQCCEIAGNLIIAGSADGALYFWPYTFSTPESTTKETEEGTEFLDYSALHDHTEAINCLSLACHANGHAASFATSSNDCSINVYSIGQR